MNNLHTLTALTGRDSNVNRTIVVQGFEARRRTVVVAAIGAVPGLLLTVILWGFIGEFAVLALPVAEGAAFWLIETRSRTGLQRRTYETLMDKKRSDAGQFYMCGRVIDPNLNELGTIMASTVAAPGFTPAPVTPELSDAGPAVVATLPVAQFAMAGPAPAPAPSSDFDMFAPAKTSKRGHR